MAIQRNLPGAREAAEEFDLQISVSTTPINAFEMCLGSYISGRRENVDSTNELIQSLILLPLDFESCVQAGKIAASLRGAGEGIDVRDALIAGVVIRHGETLVTRNLRHFNRIDGLKIKKW